MSSRPSKPSPQSLDHLRKSPFPLPQNIPSPLNPPSCIPPSKPIPPPAPLLTPPHQPPATLPSPINTTKPPNNFSPLSAFPSNPNSTSLPPPTTFSNEATKASNSSVPKTSAEERAAQAGRGEVVDAGAFGGGKEVRWGRVVVGLRGEGVGSGVLEGGG
ncbi:hypothetical protein G7Y79_00026g058490 [Physcia stellaris]|nr:hypothetical protein G7Y79_00026g058490 [Physcia stellaris]